jgi:hypothetical protein
MKRQRLTASNEAQQIQDLLKDYWSYNPDPLEWDTVRTTLIEMHVSPEEFRPPVRERTAATLILNRPALDLPAECDKVTGRFGPMKMGNVVVDGTPVKQAGTATFAPSSWKPPAGMTYVVVTALTFSPTALGNGKPSLKAVATYELTDDMGTVTEKKATVVGVLSPSQELSSVSHKTRLAFEGTPKGIQRMVDAATRNLNRTATIIATDAVKRDQGVIAFLSHHAKQGKSKAARILLSAIKASLPRIAARASMYGMSERAARIGMKACADLRLVAGRIASDMHKRNADVRVAAHLQHQAKTAKCMYAGMILSCYPERQAKTANQTTPTTVAGWLAHND